MGVKSDVTDTESCAQRKQTITFMSAMSTAAQLAQMSIH